MISFQTNFSSLAAQENLRVNGDFQSKTIQRVTSGFRINQSGDDAAGLSVANGYRSNVAELTQGVRNANDGVSMLQIVDGGMNNISKMLDRLKTLATESATDTFVGDRNILQAEYADTLTEINRQAVNINMNAAVTAVAATSTAPAIAGVTAGIWAKSLSVYVGGGAGATVTMDLSAAKVDSVSLGISTGDISDTAGATEAIANINIALGNLGTYQGSVGSSQNKLAYAVNLAESQISSFSAAESRVRDADMASEAANLTKAQVLQQASLAAMAQANSAPQGVLSLLKG